MGINKNHIDFIITRFLAGEATRSEVLQLEQWMSNSESNKKYFEGIRFVHDQAIASHVIEKFDVDAAWSNLRTNMHASKPEKAGVLILNRSVLLRVAAIFIVFVSISLLVYYIVFNKSEASVILASGSDSVLVYKMADNSVISLNKNSKLIYSSGFGKTNRNVELSGEAFFEVKHDSAIPFVVRTGKLQIKDIGTAFNVHAPENADTIEVHVESGNVAFYTDNNPGITLNKGERGIYIKSSNVFLKSGISDPNETAYATRTFEFRDRELIEIVRELNKLYKQTISLSQNGISQCRITVRFQNESLENIANILAETLGLQVVKVPGGFLLKGESCNNKP